ncbi:MAG TPA: hypothetical protein VGX78_12180 [Pirellulales bacterium]|jgi:hypothetical protein|nr:hypothetical protein [Pirellulales bacterium]
MFSRVAASACVSQPDDSFNAVLKAGASKGQAFVTSLHALPFYKSTVSTVRSQ